MALASPPKNEAAGSETNVEVGKPQPPPSASSTQEDLKSINNGKDDVVPAKKPSDKKEKEKEKDGSPKKTIRCCRQVNASVFICWRTISIFE